MLKSKKNARQFDQTILGFIAKNEGESKGNCWLVSQTCQRGNEREWSYQEDRNGIDAREGRNNSSIKVRNVGFEVGELQPKNVPIGQVELYWKYVG